MANIIEQDPLYNIMPVGQPIIFTISNTSIVGSYFNVKFVAEVYISHTTPPNMSASTDLVGTFKTTPNNAGVGIFDFSAVVENHVKADNIAPLILYKTVLKFDAPIHLMDRFVSNKNALAWLSVKFKIEGSITPTGIPSILTNETTNTFQPYEIYNAYLKHTDKLNTFQNSFGYDNSIFYPAASFPVANTKRFLTNAPTTQYANIDDYGTIALFNSQAQIKYIRFKYYDSSDSLISSEDVLTYISSSVISQSNYRLIYAGVFPANLQNWSTTFAAAVTSGLSYYTISAWNSSDFPITKAYTININCPTLKGYEPIRLTWLNQWGVWDYYTFTMKSSKTLSTKGSTYTQLEGTWNESAFKLNGYRGGKKAFRVNATEKIKMNTDFVNESESEWFEELINSPEVYILDGFQSDSSFAMLNTYVTSVRLTTSSYTRKTVANDKLMQYTFEVEKSKTLRTQSV